MHSRTVAAHSSGRNDTASNAASGLEADAETEQMLLQAIAQCEKGQTTLMADLVSELRSRE